MITQVILTVAESKRLLAKGVAKLPSVQKAMGDGIIIIGRGTTNSYVYEELFDTSIDKTRLIAGITLPSKAERPAALSSPKLPDLVIRKGELLENTSVEQILPEMGPGDIFIKGGNALDYNNRVVGILIGHPTGGTIGWIGSIISKKIELVLPIGLEKLVYSDINELSLLSRKKDLYNRIPSLMAVTGTIVTEIEALKVLCSIDAVLYSAGGIAGAEGSVRLLLEGDKDNLETALSLINKVQGESAFV